MEDIHSINDGKLKIIAVVVGVVILIGLAIYYYIKKRDERLHLKSSFNVENVSTSIVHTYPNCEITPPLDYISYTLKFTINIEDFYENFGSWRHILHKGTALDDSHMNYRYYDELNNGWDELSSDLPAQNPGIWLHPNNNNIRFAIQTVYDKDYCPESEAAPFSSFKKNRGKGPYEHDNKFSLQFFDIKDIPTRQDVSLAMTIVNNIVNVYVNGTLTDIYTVKGFPVFNKGPLYIHHPNTYSGKIVNLDYYPKILPEKYI